MNRPAHRILPHSTLGTGAAPGRRVFYGWWMVALPAPLLTTGHAAAATGAIITLVVFFGLGYGLPDLLRGTLLVDYYGPGHYPRINGTISTFVVAARAAGPLLAGLAVAAFGGHSATLVGAAALTAIGAYALHRAHRAFTTEGAAG